MAKVSYGVKTRPLQITATGIVDLENMTIEMADEGIDEVKHIFESFNGVLAKVTFEAIPQE